MEHLCIHYQRGIITLHFIGGLLLQLHNCNVNCSPLKTALTIFPPIIAKGN